MKINLSNLYTNILKYSSTCVRAQSKIEVNAINPLNKLLTRMNLLTSSRNLVVQDYLVFYALYAHNLKMAFAKWHQGVNVG